MLNDNGNDDSIVTDGQVSDRRRLAVEVAGVLNETPVIDVHTHLFPPSFGAMNLYGIDDLLTYHYLVAEFFRSSEIRPERFWKMSKTPQADLIWKTLFVENTPLSEATRGIVTILKAFDLNPGQTTLDEIREFFRDQDPQEHLDRVFEVSRVKSVVMTNDPFDGRELSSWEAGDEIDPRFYSSLRMDRLLNNWPHTSEFLSSRGYAVDVQLEGSTLSEIRSYLDKSIAKMSPLYLAASLPDTFIYPSDDVRNRLIDDILLTTARDHKLPISLMIGVRRGVNPALGAAGDGVGRADVSTVERLCVENPDVRFLVTFLSRENQHELCVAARKFSNLMPFGCWWFLNNPSIITEITNERLEMLGTTFIPQHSDARVLEQLIYKWQHSRSDIAIALAGSYDRLISVGGTVTNEQIKSDVAKLFEGNFRKWVGLAVETDGEITSGSLGADGYQQTIVDACGDVNGLS